MILHDVSKIFEKKKKRERKKESENLKLMMASSSSSSSSWQEFYGQAEAYEALLRDSTLTLFAFQRSPKPSLPPRRHHVGSMMYVLADRDLVGRICLGLATLPGGGGCFALANHGFEHLEFHDQPMILYADCEYTVPLNPTHEPDTTLDLLIKYVRHALTELLMFNNQIDKEIKINVETCHRPGVKVSFHFKIPRIIVRNMKAQQAFWLHVTKLFMESEEDRSQLMVNAQYGDEILQVSFLDMSVYEKEQGQLFRMLGAAKNEGTLHFMVPKDRCRTSITLEEWHQALILRPNAKTVYDVPVEWCTQRTAPVSQRTVTTTTIPCHEEAEKLFTLLDPAWRVESDGVRMKKTDTGSYILIPFRSFYCPLKGANHDSAATCLIIYPLNTKTWGYRIHCQSKAHPSVSPIRGTGSIPHEQVAPLLRC